MVKEVSNVRTPGSDAVFEIDLYRPDMAWILDSGAAVYAGGGLFRVAISYVTLRYDVNQINCENKIGRGAPIATSQAEPNTLTYSD